jgi:uncharacterized protein (UPF0332 family)
VTPLNRRGRALELLEEAAGCLDAAEKILATSIPKVATSQAYYAMFNAASALLAARDIHRRRHGGVTAASGEQFAREGEVWRRLHASFVKAFEERMACDYKAGHRQSRARAEPAVERAREFLDAARERLKIELDGIGGGAEPSK